MDGNNGMFPLVIFISKMEDGEHWNKLLELIAPELKKNSLSLTIMLDRCKGLLNVVGANFKGCNQRNYFRHMFKNMNKKFKGEHIKEL